jgi:dTDP-4-dehydrorhamnose reductase
MKILVTGASGLLGINFCLATAEEHEVLGVFQSNPIKSEDFRAIQADLTNPEELKQLINQFEPNLLVHCAALANLGYCEKNQTDAHLVNAILPGEIAKITANSNCKLISISTDAVFDGIIGNKSEEDSPNPQSIYGKTKLAGEILVLENDPNAIVARVNFYGWSISGKRSLAEFFINNLRKKNPINGFSDVFFSPLYVNHLISILLDMNNKDLSGLFHVVNSENISKYDFGIQLAKVFGLNPNNISPISVNDANLIAPRSNNLSLNVQKLSSALGYSVPSIEAGIEDFFTDAKKAKTIQAMRSVQNISGD